MHAKPFLVRSGRAGSLNRNACIVLHVCVYIGRRAQVTEVIYVQKSERAHGALELLTCLMSEHVRAMVPFGATTCPSSTAESGGVECVPGVPRSAASATCTVGLTAGVPPGLVSRARVRSTAPRNYDVMCRAVRVRGARCKVLVHECAETLCLSVAQILCGGCVSCTRKPR